jgi:hypothetical protein
MQNPTASALLNCKRLHSLSNPVRVASLTRDVSFWPLFGVK